MHEHTNEKLLSQSEIGRLANVPHTKLIRAIRSGLVRPDFVSGRNILFKPNRVEEIRKTLEGK